MHFTVIFNRCWLFYCMFFFLRLQAASIIPGSSAVFLQSDHLVLHDTEIVQGFVRLNNGLTIPASDTGTLDTFITVSGGIDLRDTGELQLLSDLCLDSGVTLSSGGYVKGRGHSILLNGNLTIPAGKVVGFSGDTIIQGNGNTLLIERCAQLAVDANMTLTLKNLVLKTVHASASPAIDLASSTSKLALDNVIFSSTGDCLFSEGQLFVHNDFLFTGTSAFIYQSPRRSYISSHACLSFDTGVTFNYSPSVANNDLINLTDATSKMHMNGCTLRTTTTGLRLTKGTLIIDHKNLWYNQGATSLSEAICLGNGMPSDDLTVEVMPGGSVEMSSGALVYANRS